MHKKADIPSVEEAQAALDEVRAALAASKPVSPERVHLAFASMEAEGRLRAALRAEKTPRTVCGECGKRLRAKEPVAVYVLRYGAWSPLFSCKSCARKGKDHWLRSSLPRQPNERPCPTCARPMLVYGYPYRPLFCSYQCQYRDKLRKQAERYQPVQPQARECVVCHEPFTPKRSDAQTCGNTCRQALHRRRSALQKETDKEFRSG
jgi:endogenous inhibitor of DNA gyrase (YacG/DUF329 family)